MPEPIPEVHTDDESEIEEDELNLGYGEARFASSDSFIPFDDGMEFAFKGVVVGTHAANAAALLSFEQAFEFACKANSYDGEPHSFAEAMKRSEPERSQWLKAASDEIEALIENGTFELVQLPPGRKAIGNQWVFKVKRKADGSVERYKGRLVAKGFSQRPGFDFVETLASTPCWAAIRATMAIGAFRPSLLLA